MPPILEYIFYEYGSNPFSAMWFLFSHGGSLLFIPPIVIYGWRGWIEYIQERFKFNTPYILLSVQVPQLNEQSMKAVEQIFVQLYGILDGPSKEEAWWIGQVQENFSLEIVSDGGYLTFYIRTPEYYKSLVEAAFYAQYPDALIAEAEDYSKKLNAEMIMDEKVEVWGAELVLARDDIYPIKSWPAWEHNLVGRAIDPMAQLLETMTRLQSGEHWWFQVMIQPQDHTNFRARAQKAIDEIIEPGSTGAEDWLTKQVFAFLGFWHDLFFPGDYASGDAGAGPSERQRLSGPEQELVEELDRKMSRWPYFTKIRWMYWAPPQLFDKPKGRRAMLGALQQYRFINWFETGGRTQVHEGSLFWKKIRPEQRKRKRARRMMWAYQSRDMSRGEHTGFTLNTEEIASIYHFPQLEVRAPYVTTATSRGVEPPTQLIFADQISGYNENGGVTLERPGDGDIPRVAAIPIETNNQVQLQPENWRSAEHPNAQYGPGMTVKQSVEQQAPQVALETPPQAAEQPLPRPQAPVQPPTQPGGPPSNLPWV